MQSRDNTWEQALVHGHKSAWGPRGEAWEKGAVHTDG